MNSFRADGRLKAIICNAHKAELRVLYFLSRVLVLWQVVGMHVNERFITA
jgi:hypothetical protein